MMLPNADRAVVDIAKLRDYCLNPHHEDGKHKARVFASALGLRQGDADWLRGRLLAAAESEPAIMTLKNRFGTLYVVDFIDEFIAISIRSEWLDRQDPRRFSKADDVLRQDLTSLMERISLLSLVALIDDLPGQKLTRGQIGTVVEYLDEGGEEALLVEFSDDQGRTYAMAALKPNQLIVLHRKIEAA